MKNTWRISFILFSVATVSVFSFQNCAGGFSPGDLSATSLSSNGPEINNTGALTAQMYNAAGTSQLAMNSLATGTSYMLHASGAGIVDAAVIWAINVNNNSAACSLGGTGNGLVETVGCTTAGTSEVDITSYWVDGSVSTASVMLTVTGAGPGGGTGTDTATNLVSFAIVLGTGNGAWNTSASPFVAYVGQTLRITNNDTQVHRMHTNGTPCPHQPSDSAKGAHYDCVLAAAHNANAMDLYDHDVGGSAAFYLTVIDGKALYATGSAGNCAACHGGLVGSAVHGATFAAIKSAISSRPAMQNLKLTDDQIKAISFSLSQ